MQGRFSIHSIAAIRQQVLFDGKAGMAPVFRIDLLDHDVGPLRVLAQDPFQCGREAMSGSLFASPIIINQPQSAILGIGALEKRVVVREIDGVESIQARPMAYVSLTIDHRVLDGSQTNAWLSRFVEVIQNWPQDA